MYSNGSEKRYGVFLPLLLILMVLNIMLLSSGIALFRENTSLRYSLTYQSGSVNEADKLMNQLDSIASGAVKLADSGNSHVRELIDALKKQGIIITPDSVPVVRIYPR